MGEAVALDHKVLHPGQGALQGVGMGLRQQRVRADTSGKPAPIRVASWRVVMATSEGLTRENHAPMLKPFRDFLARTSWVSRIETGNFPAARSLWRAAWIPSHRRCRMWSCL